LSINACFLDDVGWLKTFEQYYSGSNDTIQHAGVRYTLDSVVGALLLNPERKFIQCEMAFFSRWWNDATEHVRNIVRQLVKQEQLVFVGGGWVMVSSVALLISCHPFILFLSFVNLSSCSDCVLSFLISTTKQPLIGWT